MSFPILVIHLQRELKRRDGALNLACSCVECAQSVVSSGGRMSFYRFEQGRQLFGSVFLRQTRLGESAGSCRTIRRGSLASWRGRLSDARRWGCERGREAERQDSHARIFKAQYFATAHWSSCAAYPSTPIFFTTIFRGVSPSHRNGATRRNERGSGQAHPIIAAGTGSAMQLKD